VQKWRERIERVKEERERRAGEKGKGRRRGGKKGRGLRERSELEVREEVRRRQELDRI